MGERSGKKIFRILPHNDLEFRVISIFRTVLPVAHIFKQKTACGKSLGFQILKDYGIDSVRG